LQGTLTILNVAADTLIFHFLNLFGSAWGVATLLVTALLWRSSGAWRTKRRLALRLWVVLGGLGSLVLLAGLLWFGRDGKMVTYAALVLVMGSAAAFVRWRGISR
jgi:hypothetical protein